ncbi:MAG TPA: hypothetical protein VKB84_25420 [Candidatus Binataceae bacterium]|nr:hypothetical protein [Candidatus Binataceae bacterium]
MLDNAKFNRSPWAASKIVSMLGLGLFAVCFAPAVAAAQANLLCNPNLSGGSGDSPRCWQHDPYTLPPGDVTFDWLKDQQPAELEVWNYEPADSRWKQSLHLKPGWYHFTASVRVENVGEIDTGANISIMESWILSRHVKGTGYWEPIGFYLQVPKETDVELACRLGFYSSQNTGRAYFRNVSATAVTAPGADDPSFKLETWAQPTTATK